MDIKKFSDNLNDIVEMSDIDILYGIDNIIVEALDRHAPLLTKTITIRHKQPWFTDDEKCQKRVARKRKKIWKNIVNTISEKC